MPVEVPTEGITVLVIEWEDIKFDLKHFAHIERLGIVGESKWEHGMAIFCRPFTTAKMRYFDSAQLDQARKWINEE